MRQGNIASGARDAPLAELDEEIVDLICNRRRGGAGAGSSRCGNERALGRTLLRREQVQYTLDESRRTLSGRKASPLHGSEGLRDLRMQLRCVVDTDGKQKRPTSRHQVRTLVGEVPFEPEVALRTRLRIPRDDRDEERARANFAANLLIPGVAAAELTLVKPDFNPSSAERLADPLGGLRIL